MLQEEAVSAKIKLYTNDEESNLLHGLATYIVKLKGRKGNMKNGTKQERVANTYIHTKRMGG